MGPVSDALLARLNKWRVFAASQTRDRVFRRGLVHFIPFIREACPRCSSCETACILAALRDPQAQLPTVRKNYTIKDYGMRGRENDGLGPWERKPWLILLSLLCSFAIPPCILHPYFNCYACTTRTHARTQLSLSLSLSLVQLLETYGHDVYVFLFRSLIHHLDLKNSSKAVTDLTRLQLLAQELASAMTRYT